MALHYRITHLVYRQLAPFLYLIESRRKTRLCAARLASVIQRSAKKGEVLLRFRHASGALLLRQRQKILAARRVYAG